jgi:formate dehydrogenase iron-sulfur subunit
MENVAVLIDIHRCVGCEMCVYECKAANGLPDTEEKALSATAYKVVQEKAERFIPRQCMHCIDAACVSVCPVGAFWKDDTGAVNYSGNRCIGCRYCQLACPWKIPTFEWEKQLPLLQKCKLCSHRLAEGERPACVEACPFDAMAFGTREEMLALAKKRIAENEGLYVDHIYGEHEVGGTSFMYVSDVPFDELGLRTDLPQSPLPDATWKALEKVPNIALVGGSLMYGIYWITSRRDEVKKHLAEKKSATDKTN